jgi:hypothetical protein
VSLKRRRKYETSIAINNIIDVINNSIGGRRSVSAYETSQWLVSVFLLQSLVTQHWNYGDWIISEKEMTGYSPSNYLFEGMCLAHLNQHQQTQLVTSQVTSYREQIPSNFVY